MEEDALQTLIERNRGGDLDTPQDWSLSAGPGCPPELAAYLKARRAFVAATAEMTTAEIDLHDLIAEQGGRIEHNGFRYTLGKVGGVVVRQI